VDNELEVVTKAKELCRYVVQATDKSPRRFRFTFVSRMQNQALDIVEYLFLANEVFVGAGARPEAHDRRLDLQHRAMTTAKLLAYVALLAREQACITPKQYEMIAELTTSCRKMTGAWVTSDRKRARVPR